MEIYIYMKIMERRSLNDLRTIKKIRQKSEDQGD